MNLTRMGRFAWWWPLMPLAWLSLFRRIGAQPLQSWDESRLAVNAAEMLRTNHWIVTYYQGAPDLWNTKPPLLVWLQALSLHSFGYSEWAFRLPTALASLALVIVSVVFANRWLGGRTAGLVAGVALLASKGFVTHHVARTGDYEALLLLFTTCQVMAVFCWLQTRRPLYLLLAGAAIGLAILTKGVAGLFFVPGLAVEVVRRKQLGYLLSRPAAWAAVLLALLPPAVWYVLREHTAPGYLLAVWENEVGGRLGQSLEQARSPWYIYLLHFVTQQFLLWTPWVLAAAWAMLRRPAARPAHRFITLVGWVGGVFLVVISSAATKHTWYDAPIYPLLALVLGDGLTLLARQLRKISKPKYRSIAPALLLAVATVPSVVAVYARLNKTHRHRFDEPMLCYGSYLQQPAATPATRYAILHATTDPGTTSYNAPLEFYALAQRAQFHDTVEVVYRARALGIGRVTLACGKAAQDSITERYHYEVLHKSDSCATYRLTSPRSQQRVTTPAFP